MGGSKKCRKHKNKSCKKCRRQIIHKRAHPRGCGLSTIQASEVSIENQSDVFLIPIQDSKLSIENPNSGNEVSIQNDTSSGVLIPTQNSIPNISDTFLIPIPVSIPNIPDALLILPIQDNIKIQSNVNFRYT
jgi:hypothetical protein